MLQLARQSLLGETGTATETATELRGIASHELFLQVFQLAHDEPLAGHNGVQKTVARVLQRFRWPSVTRDVAESCSACAARTAAERKPRAPLQERPRADRPFHALEMDIKSPLPTTSSSFQYIAFSRYAEMCLVLRQTAEEICVEVHRWSTRYGISITVHSDRSSCFTSRAFADFAASTALFIHCLHNTIINLTVWWRG